MNNFDDDDDAEFERMVGIAGWVLLTLGAIIFVGLFFANHFGLINVIGG